MNTITNHVVATKLLLGAFLITGSLLLVTEVSAQGSCGQIINADGTTTIIVDCSNPFNVTANNFPYEGVVGGTIIEDGAEYL